jgi:hypothetical protein
MIRYSDTRWARGRLVAVTVWLAVLVGTASRPAMAEPVVNLNVGLAGEMSQGLKKAFLIEATNTGLPFDLGDIQLGLQLRPKGSVTGNLTISGVNGTGTVWTNPVTVNPPPDLNLTIAGDPPFPTGYSSISIVGGDPFTFGNAVTAALANVELEASANALGTWELYVVNEWPDPGVPVTLFGDTEFDTFQFNNFSVAQAAPSQALKIGEVVVVVPEPPAMLLGGLGLVLVGLGAWRRRVSVVKAA